MYLKLWLIYFNVRLFLMHRCFKKLIIKRSNLIALQIVFTGQLFSHGICLIGFFYFLTHLIQAAQYYNRCYNNQGNVQCLMPRFGATKSWSTNISRFTLQKILIHHLLLSYVLLFYLVHVVTLQLFPDFMGVVISFQGEFIIFDFNQLVWNNVMILIFDLGQLRLY